MDHRREMKRLQWGKARLSLMACASSKEEKEGRSGWGAAAKGGDSLVFEDVIKKGGH